MGVMTTAVTETDPFRLAEWNALIDVCFIAGCDNLDIDERGPVWVRSPQEPTKVSMHKACVEHWEPIMRVLGEQMTWEHGAMRNAGDPRV